MTDKMAMAAYDGAAQAVRISEAVGSHWAPAQVESVLALVNGAAKPEARLNWDELGLFFQVARQVGLDPLSKQIYAIKRWSKQGYVMSIQTGIDGYRAIADRTGLCAGNDDPQFLYGRDPKRPIEAKATVWKIVAGEARAFRATARWDEYAQTYKDGKPSGQWGSMPHVMLGKCAEALALRKAFPAQLSGVYTAAEMDQADSYQGGPGPIIHPAPSAAPADVPPGGSHAGRASDTKAARPHRPADGPPAGTPNAEQGGPVDRSAPSPDVPATGSHKSASVPELASAEQRKGLEREAVRTLGLNRDGLDRLLREHEGFGLSEVPACAVEAILAKLAESAPPPPVDVGKTYGGGVTA